MLKKSTTKPMKITIIDYPTTFSFNIEKKLPKFHYGCSVRSQILHEQLVYNQIETLCHDPLDYIVEEIIPIKGGEIWELGS